MFIFDPPHGTTHDAQALHATELSELLGHNNALSDQGYFGAGFLTQHHKPFGGDLLNASGKKFNRTNEIRYVIERVISQCQAWRTNTSTGADQTVPTPRRWALSSDHQTKNCILIESREGIPETRLGRYHG